jgi:hypothetical protein
LHELFSYNLAGYVVQLYFYCKVLIFQILLSFVLNHISVSLNCNIYSHTRFFFIIALLLLLLLYFLQFSFHSVAAVLTLVQTKRIRISTHKPNNKKNSKNNTKHNKYKYTYYQNTHTLVKTYKNILNHEFQLNLQDRWPPNKSCTYSHSHPVATANSKLFLCSICVDVRIHSRMVM